MPIMPNQDAEELKNLVTFVPRACPTCKELLAVKKLGVWGYYCTECLMWWGTYDPYPKVKSTGKIIKTKYEV